MPRPKFVAAAAIAFAVSLALVACGGGGDASSSTSASAPAPSPAGSSAGGGAASRSEKPKDKRPKPRAKEDAHPQAPQPVPSEVRKAGRAASFLVGGGDNSVPTYGAEASGDETRAAEAALTGFLDARAKEDWTAACSYLAVSTRKRLEEFAKQPGSKQKGCGPILGMFASSRAGSSLASPLTHGLTSLRVKAGSAFALWLGPHRQKYAMPMVREGGAWRVAQVAPLPYPPGSAP
ncbi:MAG: hypothetical protein ACTHN7_03965 [Solirubrobacterales bacterium]